MGLGLVSIASAIRRAISVRVLGRMLPNAKGASDSGSCWAMGINPYQIRSGIL